MLIHIHWRQESVLFMNITSPCEDYIVKCEILRRIVLWLGQCQFWMPGWHTGNCFSCLPSPSRPVPGSLSQWSAPSRVFSNSSDNIWQISIISKEINSKVTSTEREMSFTKIDNFQKNLLVTADTFSALSIRQHSSQIVPIGINWSDWGKKYVKAAAARRQNTCYLHSYFLRPNDEKYMSCLWIVSVHFLSNFQIPDRGQTAVDSDAGPCCCYNLKINREHRIG